MKRIIALTLFISSLMFPPSAIALPAATPVSPVQPVQVDKRELIAVAASATQNKDYQLALQVSDNVIELFPRYGTGYLYKAIALYKLGSHEAALVSFTKAKELYERQLQADSLTPQEQKEANLGLNTVHIHLKLLQS